ncbi:MAG: hypothetical protein RLZZ507_624 [Cyanobacteriota bacterium]|jgi:hypothetical protein
MRGFMLNNLVNFWLTSPDINLPVFAAGKQLPNS